MSTYIKKLLASLLAMAMVISLMPNMVLVSSASSVTEDISAEQTGSFTINGNDISKYTIVWAESILTSIKTHAKYAQFKQFLDSDEYNLQTAQRLQAYIQELCGVELPIKASSEAAGEYEILIGDVIRDGIAYATLGNVDDYEIYVAGDRLVIRGGSFGATWHALDYLEDLDSLRFDAAYRYNGNYDIIAIGVLGDSIVHGSTSSTYVKAGADGPLAFPAQLERLMWKDIAVFNYGWAGACLRTDLSGPYMNTAEAKDALNHAPELDQIMIKLGANDAHHAVVKDGAWDAEDDAKYIESMTALVEAFYAKNNNLKFHMFNSSSNWEPTDDIEEHPRPHGLPGVLAVQDVVYAQLSQTYTMSFVDFNAMTSDLEQYYSDKLHPNNEGYYIIAHRLAEYLDDVVMTEELVAGDAMYPALKVQPNGEPAQSESAALKVVAESRDGGTLTYQWYTNTENSTVGGTAIVGATDASCTPNPVELPAYVYCVVTNTNAAGDTASVATNVTLFHEHDFSAEWDGHDVAYHWHTCKVDGCDVAYGREVHTGDGDTCSTCGYLKANYYAGGVDKSWYVGHETDTTYTLTTPEELYGLAELVNGGKNFKGKTIKLGADMVINEGDAKTWNGENMPDYGWTSIGIDGWDANKEFYGTFNGQGHYISGVFQYETNGWGGGLFSSSIGATIENFALVNSYFENPTTGGHMGSIATRVRASTLRNLYSDAIIVAAYGKQVGGIVGFLQTNEGTGKAYGNVLVENCVFAGSITAANASGAERVGGIASSDNNASVEDVYVTIRNCLNLGTITAENIKYVGGILGMGTRGTVIENCINLGTVSGGSNTGAIMGYVSSYAMSMKNNYFLEGTSAAGYTQHSGATISGSGAVSATAAQLKGDVSELGLEEWSDDYCDFPVPAGVKAIYEQHATPDTEHNPDREVADCGNSKICLDCGAVIAPASGEHTDNNADEVCDVCEKSLHEHEWESEWAGDEYYAWHECIYDNCDLSDHTAKGGYHAHSYVITEGVPVCETCGYELTVSYYDGTPDTEWYDETQDEFVLIHADQLFGLIELVNIDGETMAGKTIKLAVNMVFNEGDAQTWSKANAPAYKWTPIGTSWSICFSGTFNGQNHYISGLYCEATVNNALFGFAVNATIENLALVNSYQEVPTTGTSTEILGSFVGKGSGVHMNTLYSNSILVGGYQCVGGIAARVQSTGNGAARTVEIKNCVFAGEINNAYYERVGGIVGEDASGGGMLIENCLNLGDVKATATRYTGGIIGFARDGLTVRNSVSIGYINTGYAIIGYSNHKDGQTDTNVYVENCYYSGSDKKATTGGANAAITEKITNVSAIDDASAKGAQVTDTMSYLTFGEEGWTAYTCDYPVPTAVKSMYETHYKPDMEHDYSGADADCENDKICPDCGDVLTEALGHEGYENDHICDICDKAVTECVDADGDFVCDDCGESIHVHDWQEEWEGDEYVGWHVCGNSGCDAEKTEKDGYHNHSFKANEDGIAECETCGYKHMVSYYDGSHDDTWYTNDPDATEYVLYHADQLFGLANLVNSGTNFAGKTIKLAVNMVINQGDANTWGENAEGLYGWTTIGIGTSWYGKNCFAGDFNGQGHYISGMYQKSNEWGVGLFRTTHMATIQNLAIVNSYFETTRTADPASFAGSFVSRAAYSTLKNLYSDAIIVAAIGQHTGGIAGMTVSASYSCNCHTDSTRTATLVDSCIFAGKIIAADGWDSGSGTGGIVGSDFKADDTKAPDHTLITNCLNLGSVTVYGSSAHVGGIIGTTLKGTQVTNCLNIGSLANSASTNYVGAVIGSANASAVITNCYYVDGTAEKGTGNDSAFTVMKLSVAEAKGDISALGLADWTAYGCDYPVPTGVKAIFEQFNTPDTQHNPGPEADCDSDQVCLDCGDVLEEAVGHANGGGDHICDVCGEVISSCRDSENDGDHDCDLCGEPIEGAECVDSDKNHNCDECGDKVSECIDAAPKDHYCDICNAEMGEHKSNAEYPCESGKCDYCGADMPATTEHFYPNTCSKYCDYCGLVREVEEGGHVDVNPKDHCCDFCTEIVGDHADGDDNDHLCDYCNGEVEGEECVDSDTDKDHLCDECGEPCGDHIYGEGVYTAPTTERNAYYTYTCNCGHSYDEEVPNTKLYTVVFQNWNGDVISSQTYQYGDTVVVPADPTKPEDEKYTYTFAGWTPAVVEVTGDATYTAEFTAEEKVVEHYVEFNTSTQVYLELEDIVYFVVSGLIDKTDFTTEELLDRIGLLVWTPDNSLTAENALYGTHDKVFNEARMNGSRVELITDGIPARDLADAMTFRLYVDLGNGNYAYGKLVSNYSITDKYCVSRVNKGDWDAEVCRALLNYAAAAQEYFASSESQLDYSYTKLANAGLNETQKVVNWREDLVRTNWSVPEAKEGALVRNNNVVTSRQVYLQLESKVLVTFSYAISGDIQKAEILYWTEEQYNSVDVLTEENATGRDDLELFGGRYEATYPGQAAKDMFKTIYACAKITDSNGNVSYSGVVGYSPERYVASNYNKANLPYTAALAKALAVYGDAARSAFGE